MDKNFFIFIVSFGHIYVNTENLWDLKCIGFAMAKLIGKSKGIYSASSQYDMFLIDGADGFC